MKLKIVFFLFFCSTLLSFGQSTGINNPTPNSKAALDVVASGNQGMLIPRITDAQRLAIATPPTGLICYSTTDNLIWYYNGTSWVTLPNSATNSWTQAGSNVVLTTITNNVGIGVTPVAKLEVRGADATSTNFALRISNANPTNLMTIDNAGNVTIPDLVGPGVVQSDASGTLSVLSNPTTGTGSANKVAFWSGTSALSFNTNFHWDNNNARLGIGTSLPNASLNIGSSGNNWNLFSTEGDFNIGTTTHRLKMGIATSGGGAGDAYISSQGGANRLFLGTGNTFATTQTLTLANGSVGIGNISPSYALDVAGQVNATTASTNSFGLNHQFSTVRLSTYIGNSYTGSSILGASIGTQSDNPFFIYVNNNGEKFYIGNSTQSYNIGIGTNNPKNKLDIAGNVVVGASYAGVNSAPTNGLLVQGNVGIGTTTPNAPLEFSNDITNRKIVLYETANNDHQFYGFGINGGTLRYQTDAAGADHVFFSGASSTTSSELMRIKGNGNVGIGIAPSYKLHVSGQTYLDAGATNSAPLLVTSSNTWGTAIQISNTSSGGSTYALVSAGSAHTDLPVGSFAISSFGGQHAFYMDGSNGNAIMAISDPSQKVGIGLSTPSARLHAYAPFNAGNNTVGYFENDAEAGGTAVFGQTTYNSANATSGARYGGRFNAWYGLGTHYGVYGYGFGGSTAYGVYGVASGATSTNYAGYFSGSVYTTVSYLSSDRILKNNVSPFSGALNSLKQIEVMNYTYRNDEDYGRMNFPSGNQIGFIAQNLETQFPHLVKESTHPVPLLPEEFKGNVTESGRELKYKVVNYDGMIPILTQAVKEQQLLIDSLSNSLKTSQMVNQKLATEVEEIKRTLGMGIDARHVARKKSR